MSKILTSVSFLLAILVAAPMAAAAAGGAAKTPTLNPDDHVMGQTSAPVTMIEYASLTCPHCAAFEEEDLPAIKKKWIDTGKVKLVYRDFPLDGYALKASMLARCAPDDRYFQFIESFFESQENWVTAADPTAALTEIARLGGMTADATKRCFADKKLEKAIVKERFTANKDYGVDSTPTFFILGANGTTKIEGAEPIADFDTALAAAMPKGKG
ncbi:MAG: DsbA family protein [Stellaceae bacterium]